MMRRFSFGNALTLRGRTFHRLGGWSGKPSHPPLTDLPIGAFGLGALFDVISFIGREHAFARDLYVAGKYLFGAGLIFAALTSITGLLDWRAMRSRRIEAWRVANTHLILMVIMLLAAILDLYLRATDDHARSTPASVLIVSLIVAVVLTIGAAVGGSLVFEHGVRVTAGAASGPSDGDRDSQVCAAEREGRPR